jgi:hypothetical protein
MTDSNGRHPEEEEDDTPRFRPASSISNLRDDNEEEDDNNAISSIPFSFETLTTPPFPNQEEEEGERREDEDNANYNIIVGYSSQHDSNQNNYQIQSDEEEEEEDKDKQNNPECSECNEESDADKKDTNTRPTSAPARPLTEVEEFKRTKEFHFIEKAAILSSQIIQGVDNKFDLDSTEGQKCCRSFLIQIEKLMYQLHIRVLSRKYRASFSQAYKVLYKEGSLCYLTEILDSAQEGFPYLWVNGEKFDFSENVIRYGAQLFESFCKLKQNIRHLYNKICEEPLQINLKSTTTELSEYLEDFDKKWVLFEHVRFFNSSMW